MIDRPAQQEQDVSEINEAIRREHEQLRLLLQSVVEMLTVHGGPLDEVVRRLSLLRDQLDSHFRFEESGGFFEQIADHAPRFARRVARLCEAHQEMLGEIDALLEQAMQGDGSEGWWCFMEAAFEDLAKRLMAHEREENELLQQTYTDDIGNKD